LSIIVKSLLAATIALSLVGCGTVSREKSSELFALKRTSQQVKEVGEGRIISAKLVKKNKLNTDPSVTDSVGMRTQSSTLAGASLAIAVIERMEASKEVFQIEYQSLDTQEVKTFIPFAAPKNLAKYQPGKLFRYYTTHDDHSVMNVFNTQEEFDADPFNH